MEKPHNGKHGDPAIHIDRKPLQNKECRNKTWYHSKDFSLVSTSIEFYSKPKWKGNIALALLVIMVILAALRIVPMILAAAYTAVLMIFIGIINPDNAIKSVINQTK